MCEMKKKGIRIEQKRSEDMETHVKGREIKEEKKGREVKTWET